MSSPLAVPMPISPHEGNGKRDVRDSQAWRKAIESGPFTVLMQTKRRTIQPLLVISFIFIIAMTLLAGYAKEFMAHKVFGALNVGYLMVLMTYLLCWVVAVIYVRTANNRFDPQAAAAIRALDQGAFK